MTDKINSYMLGIGSALHVMIGMQKCVPLWMQNISLEWLFRLAQEPKRLFKSYLITNTLFILIFLNQRITFFLIGLSKLKIKLIVQYLTKISIFIIAFSIFYFSWLPSGEFGDETHLPQWLLTWCNTYYNLRTAIPFVILAFLMTLKYKTMHVLIICLVLLTIAEVGQYFRPNRSPDYRDIFYGLLGTFFGIVSAFFCIKKRRKNP